MIRGFPPSELASTTAMPGTIANASPTERNGSARIKAPGTAVTATVEVRMLVADRSGVTTTVSSRGTAESPGARLETCARTGKAHNATDREKPNARRQATITVRCANGAYRTTSRRQRSLAAG